MRFKQPLHTLFKKVGTFLEECAFFKIKKGGPGGDKKERHKLQGDLQQTLRRVQIGLPKVTCGTRVWTVNSQGLLHLTPLKLQTVVELELFLNSKQPLRRILHVAFFVIFLKVQTVVEI